MTRRKKDIAEAEASGESCGQQMFANGSPWTKKEAKISFMVKKPWEVIF